MSDSGMTSTLRDLEDGTTVCTDCGKAVEKGITTAQHKEWECGLDTQKPLTSRGQGQDCIFHREDLVGSSAWTADVAAHGHTVSYALDTEKPSSGQDKDSSALSGVSPGKGATDTLAQQMEASIDSANKIMASMPPGLVMSQDHRYWFNGEGPRPSVTTVLEILSKPALVYWKGQEVARAIYRDSKAFFGESWEQGEDAAIKWAMGKADEQRDRAAKLGSSVHLLADMASRGAESDPTGFQVSEEEKPYLDAWMAFLSMLEASGASIVSSEHAVWGDGYAGTYDLIVQMPEPCTCHPVEKVCNVAEHGALKLWMIDIKTSKGIYPEYALQLAAYGNAPSIILPNDPQLYPMPKIDRYAVLHLRPDQYPTDGYKLIEYPVTERDYYAFVSCLDMYEWRAEGRFEKSRLLA